MSRNTRVTYYGPKNKETDRVEYNRDGLILSWECWSDACNEWLPVSTEYIIQNLSSKFERMLEQVNKELSELEAV